MLICSSCRKEMIILELDGVEIDYCPACGSIWLDSGEIELLSGTDFVQQLHEHLSDSEKKKPCPICKKKMEKKEIPVQGEKAIVLDLCPLGHGIWFDNGELAQILEHQEGCSDSVRQFLLDIFKRS